jgi:type I restriction enzyme S subunit
MGSDWRECQVADIAASTPSAMATGPFGSAISSRFFQDSGVPVIRGSNLSEEIGLRLREDDLAFLAPQKAAEFQRSVARRGDLVFTCWGTVGQVGLVDGRSQFPEYIVSNKQMKLTPDPNMADSLFLYYLFSSPAMVERIRNESIGSSVPGFNLGQLRGLRLSLPPLSEQRRIASILSSLDDKIELNRRMSQTLESLAHALFMSWFIQFDPVRCKSQGRQPGLNRRTADLFPDSFVTSDLGLIPKGWSIGSLGDVAVERRRAVRPADLFHRTPYVGLEHMPRRSIALSDWGTVSQVESGKLAFRRGEILFGKLRPYFHKVAVAPVDGVCSTDIVVIGPKSQKWFGFVLGHVASDAFVDSTEASSTGTKMPRTNWADMASYRVILPDERIAEAYSRKAFALVSRAADSAHECKALSAIRDSLLPRLISGDLDIHSADA